MVSLILNIKSLTKMHFSNACYFLHKVIDNKELVFEEEIENLTASKLQA